MKRWLVPIPQNQAVLITFNNESGAHGVVHPEMLRNPELFSARICRDPLPVAEVSAVGDDDEEGAEHDVAQVGVDVVEVGHEPQLHGAQEVEVAEILQRKQTELRSHNIYSGTHLSPRLLALVSTMLSST